MTNITELGKKKLFKNLIDKLNAGKTLTANERKQYDELADLFDESAKTQTSGNPLEVPRTVVAALFSVTTQTIANWVDKGMPKLSRGIYNLKDCFQWWQRAIDGGGGEEMEANKTRYWKEMADGKEIENEVSRGSLISRSEVIESWAWRCSDLRTGLLSWSSRLPPLLEGKDSVELRLALRDCVDELLQTFTRDGKFTPKSRSEPRKKPARKTKKRR